MEKNDAIDIVYPRVSGILKSRNHLASLAEMQKEKEASIGLAECDLLDQIEYVIHKSGDGNENFSQYLKEEMPHDTDGYDTFVSASVYGGIAKNIKYFACAIRYALLEKATVRVIVANKELLEEFKAIFSKIAENLNLRLRPYNIVFTESGLYIEEK